MNTSKYIVAFAAKQLQRYEAQDFNTVPIKDMLDRFKRTKDEEQLISSTRMRSHATRNIFAGSDTAAASLRSIFYNLCHNPQAHDTLLTPQNGMENYPIQLLSPKRRIFHTSKLLFEKRCECIPQ